MFIKLPKAEVKKRHKKPNRSNTPIVVQCKNQSAISWFW